ncbi:hypothetical protein A4A49_18416 [Nicotiana attenuata]|uniref:Uncharacterized protein n=1 Tax=Nicotiana attenuata TaxID=49451 RepID=A0A314KGU2_NICAT|nr:hypothetical protein A4A49_18416 [Nicotiana attenuata]
MGCFFSSTKKTPSNPTTSSPKSHRSPPLTLPFLEEEKVKEVLSETPTIPKNNHQNILEQKNHNDSVLKIAMIFNPKEQLSQEPRDRYRNFSRSIRVGSDSKETGKELSRHIRVGSHPKDTIKELSRHIRVGSDPKEMIKDVGTELRQRSPAKKRNNASPAKIRPEHLSGSGQTRNASPARIRSEHLSGSVQTRNTSPARIRSDHLSGSGQIRNISPSRVGSGKNTGGLSRKDNGESSFRRTRSPVMCADQNGGTRNSISRCPSARKSGKSPGRVRSELGDRRRKPPAEAGNSSYRENRDNKQPLKNGNESLENPLVSMECFIFL